MVLFYKYLQLESKQVMDACVIVHDIQIESSV